MGTGRGKALTQNTVLELWCLNNQDMGATFFHFLELDENQGIDDAKNIRPKCGCAER